MNWNGGARSRFQQPGGCYRGGQFHRTYQLDTRPRHGDRDNGEFGVTEHVESRRDCPLLDFIREELPGGEILALQLSHQMELDVEPLPTGGYDHEVSSSGRSSPQSQSDRHVSWSQSRMSSLPDDDESRDRDRARDLLSSALDSMSRGHGHSSYFNLEGHSNTSERPNSIPDFGRQEPMDMSIEDEGLLADEIIRSVLDSSPEMWNTPPTSPLNSHPNETRSAVVTMQQSESESKSKSI